MRLSAFLVALLCLACPAPMDPTPCGDGQQRAADGVTCEPIPAPACVGALMPVAGSTECRAVGWRDCAQGFKPDPSGVGCVEVMAAQPCAPGTMPRLGKTECQPVGWQTCPNGFVRAPSGWGCVETSPPMECTGATFERIGQATCQPVGDCAAPFPPAGATLFVDDSYQPGQLDATHFTSVQAALTAAAAGATIAVEAGTYTAPLTAARAVTLVGRCAAQVHFTGTQSAIGLRVTATGVDVRGVSIEAQQPAVQVEAGASVTLTSVVLSGNKKAGVFANGAGSSATLRDSVVRGTVYDSGRSAYGALAQGGAHITASSSAFVRNQTAGLGAVLTGSLVQAERVILAANGVDGENSAASAWADRGGRIELLESAIIGSFAGGMLVTGSTSQAKLTKTVVRRPGTVGQFSVAVATQAGSIEVDQCAFFDHDSVGALALAPGTLTITNTDIVLNPGHDTPGGGLELNGAATLTLTSSATVNVGRAGILALGPARITVKDSLFQGTREGTDQTGYMSSALALADGPITSLEGTAIIGSQGSGFSLGGAGSAAQVSQTIIRGTHAGTKGATPTGAVVGEHATLVLLASLLAENEGIGLAVGYSAKTSDQPGTATVAQVLVRDTLGSAAWPEGAGVVAKFGSSLSASDSAVVRSALAGLDAADARTTVQLERLVIRDSLGSATDFAYGMIIRDGAQATLTESVVRNVPGIGVLTFVGSSVNVSASAFSDFENAEKANGVRSGLAMAAVQARLSASNTSILRAGNTAMAWQEASGVVDRCLFRDNHIALQAQGGSMVTPVAVATEPSATQVQVTDSSVFESNETKLGATVIPLPTVHR